MSEIFSADWMSALKEGWNSNPAIKDKLAEIGFSSVIAYGYKEEEKPRSIFVVENGECVSAGDYNGEDLDWDIRANPKDWKKWASKGIGMAGLGMAYASGKMKFKTGDYGAMMKNPKMAGPFIKNFGLMKGIDTTW